MREVYLDFGDGFVDVSHLVKYETLKYSQRAYNDSYRYAQNDCSFTLIYDEVIFNQLYLGEAKVKITKDSIPVFLGHTTPNKTKKYNGIANISTYRIDAIDDLDYMEVEVGDVVYADCKVLDPLNPTQSIVHKLANIAGWDNNRINSSVTIDTVIERFAPTSPEDMVLEVLNTLLYEYGYTLSLDANGNIEFHKWIFPSDTSYSVEFTEENILLEIERKDSIKKYDSIKTYYYDMGFAEKVMLYRDSNCSYNADGTFKGVAVLNNTYYPFEANVIDETTGTNTIVEQDYTDESIRYFTNKAIKENLDYNYKAFSSDFSAMIATENHFLDSRYDSPMTVTHSFGNKKCQLLYHNTSGSSKDIWYSNVFGDVWYKSTERTCTVDIKDEVKDVYEYRSKYVFDKEVANRFTKALAALYKIGKVYYSFPSEADYAVGAICRLVLKDTNVLAQIVEKTWNEDKEYWEYQIIQTSFEPLDITGTTTSVKVDVITAGAYEFTTSSGQIVIPYTDNIPSFANAIIELNIKRNGVSYLDDWIITATPTNCTGSFTGKGTYKISSVSSTAASITFTAINSFWGTLEKTVYISRSSDEIGEPNPPTGLHVVTTEYGIDLSISLAATGENNVIQKVKWQIKKDATWVDLVDIYGAVGSYVFNRSTEGYPEVSDMSGWQFRAQATNVYNKTSSWSVTVGINTDTYGTWLLGTTQIKNNTSKRLVNLSFSQSTASRVRYGSVKYQVEIKKSADGEWYKPNLVDDPYASEDNYKDGSGYVEVTNNHIQTVPMEDQDAGIKTTVYQYRVRAVHEQTGEVGEYETVTVTATASTAMDLYDESIGAEKLTIKDLASITNTFGSISSDAIEKDATQFWNLSREDATLGYGMQGEFNIGTTASVEPYDEVLNPDGYKEDDDFLHWIPSSVIGKLGTISKGLYLKLANFLVTAIESVIKGTFRVLGKATGSVLFEVNEDTQATYGRQEETRQFNVPTELAVIDGLEEAQLKRSVVVGNVAYHLSTDGLTTIVQNLLSCAESTISNPKSFKWIEAVGSDLFAVVGSECWKLDSFVQEKTLFSANRYRFTSQIHEGKLYIPCYNSTIMEIVDLLTLQVTEVTLSSANRDRYTSQIHEGKLYIPCYNSTIMEVVDLATMQVTEVTLSSTNRNRYTSQLHEGKMYIPCASSTIMEIVDLATMQVTEVTLSSTNRYRYTSHIYEGKLYIPCDNSAIMEIVDLLTLQVTEVTLSSANRSRRTSQIYEGKLCIPCHGSTIMEIVDLLTLQVTEVTLFSANRNRRTSQIYEGKLYIPCTSSTIMEIVDLATMQVTEVTLSSADRNRRTSQIHEGKLYIPCYTSTIMEIVDLQAANDNRQDAWWQVPIDWLANLLVQEKTLFSANRNRRTSQIYEGKLYIPCTSSTIMEIVDLATMQVTEVTLSSTDRNRRTIHIYEGKMYIPCDSSTIMEVVDLATMQVTEVTLFSANRYRYTSQLHEGKMYIPCTSSTIMEIVDLATMQVTEVTLSSTNRYRYTSHIYEGKMYIPCFNSTIMEVVDLATMQVTEVTLFSAKRYRYTSHIYEGKMYIPCNNSTTMEIVDLLTLQVTKVTLSSANRNRRTSQIHEGKLYIPCYNSTIMEIVDLLTLQVTEVTLFSANRDRYTSQIHEGKLYIPCYNSTIMEVVDLHKPNQNTANTIAPNKLVSTSPKYLDIIDVANGEYQALPAPYVASSMLAITVNNIAYFPDFTTGKMTVYNGSTASSVNIPTIANIKTLVTEGTYIYASGKTNKVYRITTTGTYTELELDISPNIYWTLGIVDTTLFVMPETSHDYFMTIDLSTFTLDKNCEFKTTWSSIRGKGFTYNDQFWLSEGTRQHRITGTELALVRKRTLKEIGSGFVERVELPDGKVRLYTADGDVYDPDTSHSIEYLEQAVWALGQPFVTKEATMTATTNNILCADLATDLAIEIGDVIRIQYDGYDKLHTVESISGNNIVVNYEHCGNRGNGSLKLVNGTRETTFTRIAKWYNAPIGLGQAWVDIQNAGLFNRTNTTGRSYEIVFATGGSSTFYVKLSINDKVIINYALATDACGPLYGECISIANGETYTNIGSTLNGGYLRERR